MAEQISLGPYLENITCYTGLVIKNRMCEVTEFKVKYRGHQTWWRNKVRRQKLQNVYIHKSRRIQENSGSLIKSRFNKGFAPPAIPQLTLSMVLLWQFIHPFTNFW